MSVNRDEIPQKVGRYVIVDAIGFGAMGAVYKAFDPLIKRTVAIKTIRLDIPPQSPQYRSFIERFYHEARISGTLSHPNIVTLFDIGETEDKIPFLAMEFVQGETVADILSRGDRFRPEQVVGLVSQMASAIDYAHGKGVIHRDIKPSNIMIHDGEKVKITDFGIAKLIDSEVTQGGTLLGTPSYMSPEQAMGETLDGRTDIFSLGVVAFEMLSSEQPFPGNNVTSILYKLVHVDPIRPSNLEVLGLLPDKWHEVFSKALAKSPADRYATAGEFVAALELCLGSWFGALAGETVVMKSPAAEEDTVVPSERDKAGSSPGLGAIDSEERTVLYKPSGATPTPRPDPSVGPPASAEAVPDADLDMALESPSARASAPVPSQEELGEETVTVLPPRAGAPASARGARSGGSSLAGADAEQEDATVVALPEEALGSRPASSQRSEAASPQGVQEDATVLAYPDEVRVSWPAPPEPTTQPFRLDEVAAAAEPTLTTGRPLTGRPRRRVATISRKAPARRGWLLGALGAALVLAVAVVAIGLKLRDREEPAPAAPVVMSPPLPAVEPPPEPPAEVSGVLSIETDPSGATVTLNGEARGLTPLALDQLPLGSYAIRLEKRGYQTEEHARLLSTDSPTAALSVSLKRAAPSRPSGAELEISSAPPGATVSVDGKPVGTTPLQNLRALPGARSVRLHLEGYKPWERQIELKTGEVASIKATLEPVEVAPPPLPSKPVEPQVREGELVARGPGVADPRCIQCPSVAYPETARRARIQGSVEVSFIITETGAVQDIKVEQSAGEVLDQAVINAVKEWRFQPATKNGVKVKVRDRRRMTFKLGR